MIELGKTGGELAAFGAWGSDDNNWFGGFYVRIFAVAFFANDGFDVGWITFGWFVNIGGDFIVFELFDKFLDFFLAGEKSDDHIVDFEIMSTEKFNKTKNLGFIRDHAVGADFRIFDIITINAEDDF